MGDYLSRIFPNKSPQELAQIREAMNAPVDDLMHPDVIDSVLSATSGMDDDLATWAERKAQYGEYIAAAPQWVVDHKKQELEEALERGSRGISIPLPPPGHFTTPRKPLPEGVTSLWNYAKKRASENEDTERAAFFNDPRRWFWLFEMNQRSAFAYANNSLGRGEQLTPDW